MADVIFGGVCRLTLASASATWDLDYLGPGVVCDKRGFLEVHTENGIDVKFDKRDHWLSAFAICRTRSGGKL